MEKLLKREKTLHDIEKDRPEISACDYDMELEMLKSTRENFLTWKDYDY